jgi:hypothetical protein
MVTDRRMEKNYPIRLSVASPCFAADTAGIRYHRATIVTDRRMEKKNPTRQSVASHRRHLTRRPTDGGDGPGLGPSLPSHATMATFRHLPVVVVVGFFLVLFVLEPSSTAFTCQYYYHGRRAVSLSTTSATTVGRKSSLRWNSQYSNAPLTPMAAAAAAGGSTITSKNNTTKPSSSIVKESLAGLTVAFSLLSKAMACSTIVGVSPLVGIWSSVVMGITSPLCECILLLHKS